MSRHVVPGTEEGSARRQDLGVLSFEDKRGPDLQDVLVATSAAEQDSFAVQPVDEAVGEVGALEFNADQQAVAAELAESRSVREQISRAPTVAALWLRELAYPRLIRFSLPASRPLAYG
jgi:hypothetical protein